MIWRIVIGSVIFASIIACGIDTEHKVSEKMKAPPFEDNQQLKDFVKDATIYEVNIRQYTPEGTLEAFRTHLDRLQEMGIKIIWLMPVHPIGSKKRKGELGSYYSIRDYFGINEEFGTEEDFRRLVEDIHSRDMIILMDWVANHTAWDHEWVAQHPEFYLVDSLGQIVSPVADWSDVAGLNYDDTALRDSMIQAMQNWVEEYEVDGYRCDVAGMVPTDFWEQARDSLNAIRPVFMLAEAEKLELHRAAFEMGYAWELHHIMNSLAKGEYTTDSIRNYFERQEKIYPDSVIRMNFTSNHDENTWKGNAPDRFGELYENMIVLSFTVPGMPLIYGGQEAALSRELAFFEKDTISWRDSSYDTLFHHLIELKKEEPCLHNGAFGGELEFIDQENNELLVYRRFHPELESEVLVILNMSSEKLPFDFNSQNLQFNHLKSTPGGKRPASTIFVEPWGYKLYSGV